MFLFLAIYNAGCMTTLQVQHCGIYPSVGKEHFADYMRANNRALGGLNTMYENDPVIVLPDIWACQLFNVCVPPRAERWPVNVSVPVVPIGPETVI